MIARTHCGGCQSPDLMPFLDLGASPLADVFPATPDAVEPRYPLRAAACRSCWLVQLLDVVPDELLYGADYGFYSSTSPSIRAYDVEFARWALDRFGDEAKRGVVEIACNDGSLLQHFAQPGVPFLGVEPSVGPAAVAMDRGLNVRPEPFTAKLANALVDECGGPVGLVIAKNVAAHVADLPDFLAGIAHLIGDDGVAVIEVQDVAALLLGNQIDHFYHEHRFYFSHASLAAAAWRAGLVPGNYRRTPAQGGSIRAVFRRRQGATAAAGVRWDPMPGNRLCDMAPYAAMQHRAEELRGRLLELLDAEQAAGRTVYGYGATAKSATLLNWCGIGPDRLQYVEDTTPYKIGRYTPGTGIRIVERDMPSPDTYLLLAWNYLGDVLRRERVFTEAGGRWIVPIPVPVVL